MTSSMSLFSLGGLVVGLMSLKVKLNGLNVGFSVVVVLGVVLLSSPTRLKTGLMVGRLVGGLVGRLVGGLGGRLVGVSSVKKFNDCVVSG